MKVPADNFLHDFDEYLRQSEPHRRAGGSMENRHWTESVDGHPRQKYLLTLRGPERMCGQ